MRGRALALSLLLVTLPACSSARPRVTPPVDDAHVLFRIHPAVGTRYRRVMTMDMHCDDTFAHSSHHEMMIDEVRVDAVDADSGDVTFSGTSEWRTDTPGFGTAPHPIHYVLDERGAGRRQPGADSFAAAVQEQPGWPEAPVAVGETWVTQLPEPVALDAGVDASVMGLEYASLRHTLVEITGTDDERIAVIDEGLEHRRNMRGEEVPYRPLRRRYLIADPLVYSAHREDHSRSCTSAMDIQVTRELP
jgi:hypothetical protein